MGPYKYKSYYKICKTIGIKDKTGRQVFSFGGKSSKLKEAELRTLGMRVLSMLNNKELEVGAAAAWAKKQC